MTPGQREIKQEVVERRKSGQPLKRPLKTPQNPFKCPQIVDFIDTTEKQRFLKLSTRTAENM
ncbi:hypothetical protein [Brucella intermedia]|uniref:hypothetical protein n=1 Tax=Brucella intermedia TaxID=94625 RepID=UPI00110F77A4|nr:hypothetical protein [Brucella intermedia]